MIAFATIHVKYLPSQLAYLLDTRATRSNLRALARYLLFLAIQIIIYAVLFHVIMIYEGREHSWLTGFYWTLVVMSTLGFGDVTFTSDLGRFFTIIVLMSGVIFLLVMLPFLFIRLFYAPWLEARMRFRAPREVPRETTGHVIITEYDAVAASLVTRLQAEAIPFYVVEPDPTRAARLIDEGLPVVSGELDNRVTYERLRAPNARLVLATSEDKTNTNITLTVREVSAEVPVAAFAEHQESVDVLRLAGATTPLPLKQHLGEYLGNRVYAGAHDPHVIGAVRGLQIAELSARDTPFAGQTIRDTRLRERTGVNVLGFWERGRLQPAFPDAVIAPERVFIVAGLPEQIAALDALLPHQTPDPAGTHVIVVGAGVVGIAAAQSIKARGLTVNAVDKSRTAVEELEGIVDSVFVGNAADRRVLERAGLSRAASIVLTTNDDATNIYLALYCRRLRQDLRIVSRVTHERNVEAIHRAGADFVLSYTSLGVDAVTSLLHGHETVLLGEGVELFSIPVPASLVGRPLKDSGIGARTGMSVVALQRGDRLVTGMTGNTVLSAGTELMMLGSIEQRRTFAQAFERPA